MADYYPLLARALDALPDRSPDLRKAVYDRARGALNGQLRSIVPPLSEEDIERESLALETAIARLEADHAGTLPVPGALSEPALVEPALPPAATAAIAPAPSPVIPLGPRRTKAGVAEAGASAPVSDNQTAEAETGFRDPAPPPPFEATDDPAETAGLPGTLANVRQRPRIDVVAPRRSNARLLRNVFVGSVLAIVIGLIATAAYLLRDKPSDIQTAAGDSQTAAAEGNDAKYADRVGGESAPAERATPGPATAPTAGSPTPALPPQPDVAVAQRAVLIEENRDPSGSGSSVSQGRVVWRLDAVNGERGQPLETAVQATIEFPEAGLSLSMTLRRNLDATLPASHTIELAFTNTATAGAARAVQDVGLLHAKDEENARGSPLSGLPVRVRENLFLIGLSSLRNDVDRNSDLLLQKNWFDLALKFSSGTRAVITFEKGSSGLQVMQSAFTQWRS